MVYVRNKNNIREFTYADPIMLDGKFYPSAVMPIEGDNGLVSNRRIFAANKGYYSMDGNEARPIIQTYNLPEVTVTAPRLNRPLAASVNDLTINSNDNTQVNNLPHREYNQHQKERVLRGAAMNAIWEKENPNATALRDFAEGAVMTLPLWPAAGAAADALAGTTAGQAITNGLNFASKAIGSNRAWPFIDAGISSYFGAEGINDIRNGKFTPETAMDLMPLGRGISSIVSEGKHLATNIQDYYNLNKFINRYGYNEYNPRIGLIFDDTKLDKLTNQLVKQHNTFTRGISVDEARRYWGFPESWTDEQIAEYTLTHPHRPTLANSGGNPNQEPVLYTSNSLDLSRRYADGNGYIGILQRPIIFDSNRSKMLKANDFRFNRDISSPLSATTDEPYMLMGHAQKIKGQRIKGATAYKRRGKVISDYATTEPTFLDAQANAGSEIISVRKPDDLDFRHYLWYGDPDNQLLELKGLLKYSKPTDVPSVDYAKHSVGFSKKKALGGKL